MADLPHPSAPAQAPQSALGFAPLAVLALATLLACSSTPPTPQDLSGRARMIGIIDVVRSTDNFVLIQSVAAVTEDAGTEIISYNRDGDETGRLRLSAERRRALLTADVLSGNPVKGDYAVIPGTDGQAWVPEALPPVMIDDGSPTVVGLPDDLDSLPDLQPPPGVERLQPDDLPAMSLPPGVEPGDLTLPGPPTDLGPLDLPPPPPPGSEHELRP